MNAIKRIQMPYKSRTALYSDAVIFGNLMVISGMLPTDDSGRVVGLGDAKAQADQVFQNIRAVLDMVGANFSDIVKLSIFLTDIQLRSEISSVRTRYFGDDKPASTLLEISKLAHPDAMMEIEAMVYLGN